MDCFCGFFSSSIGKKVLMALSGGFLLLFVIAHLLGNLQVFAGPDKFNAYAALLKSMPQLIWPARLALLLVFGAHFVTAVRLWESNRKARPEAYNQVITVQATTASLYMLETGIVILIFVIVHLLHFTFGILQPQYFNVEDALGRHHVYYMLVRGFQSLPYSLAYIICMILLGIHLSHGISSMFQTLGLRHKKYFPYIELGGKLLALLIAVGYISIPLAVLGGIITIPR